MLGTLQRRRLGWLVVWTLSCASDSRADTMSEAREEAARIVSSVILTLPDGTSMGMSEIRVPMSSNWSTRYWHHSEFKWALVEEPLSAADRLNGMTWKGEIKSTMAAYRELFESSSALFNPCWFPWQDVRPEGNLKWSLQKIRGQWKSNLDGATSLLVGNKLPTQAEADRVLKLPLCP
jgi:hypothetical protein